MKWIGLTGGIASGKSTAAQILKDAGFVVVDADQIARHLVRPGQVGFSAVVQKFGLSILNPSGEIDRVKLGDIVFRDSKLRQELEFILHPLVKAEVLNQRKDAQLRGQQMAFYDVPLLFENKIQKDFDAIVLITCSQNMQLQRLQKRNHLTAEQAELRLQSQLPLSEKEKHADFVIANEGSSEELKKELLKVATKLLVNVSKS